jgi:hypothetical protein
MICIDAQVNAYHRRSIIYYVQGAERSDPSRALFPLTSLGCSQPTEFLRERAYCLVPDL